MTPLRLRMLEQLQLRNLSETTIQTYLRLVERFAKHFGVSPTKLGPDHVRRYLLHLLNDRKDTWGTVQVNRGRSSSSTSEFSNSPGLTWRLRLPKGGRGCPQ